MTRSTQQWFAVLAVVVASSGCAREARILYAPVAREAPLEVIGDPTLVAIDDGIWVVRNADHAVYYVEDWYWVVHEDKWYRSFSHELGWSKVEERAVPRSVIARNHGYYTFYQGQATAQTRRPPIGKSNTAASSVRTTAAEVARRGSTGDTP